ncbi:MAG: UDP-N-acetylmuramoyl-tripeptide--D-alanyl-D-alanine ligase [Muribaculaceae bacterium]|nr:UDP-N-acetylmuramoyl-tripeptide--D-alanyl-D-alanine ligase [Muribaculaceae bacterium]
MSAFTITIYVICGIYMLLNFKHDIHMLQQNSYRPERYWRYLRKNDLTSPWRMVDVAMLLFLLSTLLNPVLRVLLIALVCVAKCFIISRRKFKKPLVFTSRVKRIYGVIGVISAGAVLAEALTLGVRKDVLAYYSGVDVTLGTLLLICIFSWAVVMLAILILSPVEKSINARYRNEAVSILSSMPDLTVVGITGSYGKTSTKHYLHRILSESYDVLMTPGSYNTPMGVIRTVREMMKPYYKVFICEMGAKQKGDIKEICDMVHPSIGIVTAVGPMHLETFKSIENVQSTKFELIDALPAEGFAVVNDDFEYCANRSVNNVGIVRYAVSNTGAADYRAEDIRYSPRGTTFTVVGPDNLRLPLNTKLVGECNISNLLAAVAVAIHLKVPHDKIQYAVASIEQVEHRLNIKRTPGGVTIIDDAFNSNPSGSRMAVDVLSGFTDGRRVIVTPGMIELGDRQFELNKELGRHIASGVDTAIIVGEYNREALVAGAREGGMDESGIIPVASFGEAQQVLSTMLKAGDTVLYENDLPDSFK